SNSHALDKLFRLLHQATVAFRGLAVVGLDLRQSRAFPLGELSAEGCPQLRQNSLAEIVGKLRLVRSRHAEQSSRRQLRGVNTARLNGIEEFERPVNDWQGIGRAQPFIHLERKPFGSGPRSNLPWYRLGRRGFPCFLLRAGNLARR